MRSPRLLLALPVAAAAALTLGVAPAAAPPVPASVKAPAPAQPDQYKRARKHGAPIAMLLRPTVLRATPGGREIARVGKMTEWGSPRVYPALERRGDWLRVIATELPNGRSGWISIQGTEIVANPWSVTADVSDRRVTVRKHGRVVRRFTVAVGGSNTPTPLGRYAVTDKLELTGGHPAYGCCALALSGHQAHLAQGWRGGNRLAIHGTRLTGTLGTAASLGCLRAGDRDARWIISNLFLGTVVRIRP